MNKIKIIRQDKNPEVLIVTPLLPNHTISKKTKTTLKRNKTPLFWITSTGKGNIPVNAQYGINWYKKKYGTLPEFYIMIDNDIDMGRGMIDKLVHRLRPQEDFVAFAYASFKFVGVVNAEFPAVAYDVDKLMEHNYISSQSLIRTKCLEKIGGLVTDSKYVRLLDWALWLKFFYNDLIGINCPTASFVATASEGSVSSGSDQDYNYKRSLVLKDFVTPIIEKYIELNKK